MHAQSVKNITDVPDSEENPRDTPVIITSPHFHMNPLRTVLKTEDEYKKFFWFFGFLKRKEKETSQYLVVCKFGKIFPNPY